MMGLHFFMPARLHTRGRGRALSAHQCQAGRARRRDHVLARQAMRAASASRPSAASSSGTTSRSPRRRTIRARAAQVPGNPRRGRDSLNRRPRPVMQKKRLRRTVVSLTLVLAHNSARRCGAISDRLPPDQGECGDQVHALLVASLTDIAPATRPA